MSHAGPLVTLRELESATHGMNQEQRMQAWRDGDKLADPIFNELWNSYYDAAQAILRSQGQRSDTLDAMGLFRTAMDQLDRALVHLGTQRRLDEARSAEESMARLSAIGATLGLALLLVGFFWFLARAASSRETITTDESEHQRRGPVIEELRYPALPLSQCCPHLGGVAAFASGPQLAAALVMTGGTRGSVFYTCRACSSSSSKHQVAPRAPHGGDVFRHVLHMLTDACKKE